MGAARIAASCFETAAVGGLLSMRPLRACGRTGAFTIAVATARHVPSPRLRGEGTRTFPQPRSGEGARSRFACPSPQPSPRLASLAGRGSAPSVWRNEWTTAMTALLRRLLPSVAVALGLGLEAQVSPLLAVAGAVAENLLLAGEILRRTMDARGAVPGRRLHGEVRVDQVRARQRDEIGAAGGDDGVDLVGGRDRADAHRRERGLVADLIGERRLEHAAEDGLRVRDGLSGRHVDEIATGIRKRARDLDGVVAGKPAIHPVRRRNAHRHRL